MPAAFLWAFAGFGASLALIGWSGRFDPAGLVVVVVLAVQPLLVLVLVLVLVLAAAAAAGASFGGGAA